MLSHEDCKIYTANIGDSGFLVVRHGKVSIGDRTPWARKGRWMSQNPFTFLQMGQIIRGRSHKTFGVNLLRIFGKIDHFIIVNIVFP